MTDILIPTIPLLISLITYLTSCRFVTNFIEKSKSTILIDFCVSCLLVFSAFIFGIYLWNNLAFLSRFDLLGLTVILGYTSIKIALFYFLALALYLSAVIMSLYYIEKKAKGSQYKIFNLKQEYKLIKPSDHLIILRPIFKYLQEHNWSYLLFIIGISLFIFWALAFVIMWLIIFWGFLVIGIDLFEILVAIIPLIFILSVGTKKNLTAESGIDPYSKLLVVLARQQINYKWMYLSVAFGSSLIYGYFYGMFFLWAPLQILHPFFFIAFLVWIYSLFMIRQSYDRMKNNVKSWDSSSLKIPDNLMAHITSVSKLKLMPEKIWQDSITLFEKRFFISTNIFIFIYKEKIEINDLINLVKELNTNRKKISFHSLFNFYHILIFTRSPSDDIRDFANEIIINSNLFTNSLDFCLIDIDNNEIYAIDFNPFSFYSLQKTYVKVDYYFVLKEIIKNLEKRNKKLKKVKMI